MQAVILAAGMGRRLKKLTENQSKCMVPVNGVPMIERMLRQLDRYGLEQIILVTGHKGSSCVPLSLLSPYIPRWFFWKIRSMIPPTTSILSTWQRTIF